SRDREPLERRRRSELEALPLHLVLVGYSHRSWLWPLCVVDSADALPRAGFTAILWLQRQAQLKPAFNAKAQKKQRRKIREGNPDKAIGRLRTTSNAQVSKAIQHLCALAPLRLCVNGLPRATKADATPNLLARATFLLPP